MSFDIAIERRIGDRSIRLNHASEGGLIALFGPSGVGKTSILNMVAGLLRPDRGRIVISGQTLFDSDHDIDIAPEKRRIGYIFQDGRLFPHMRVRANLTYGLNLIPPDEHWLSLDETCAFLGITPLLDRWPRSLSGGEAQRVSIGRAMLAAPRILLMDEPLVSLDTARRDEILGVIERLRDEFKLPILYVSHDRQEIDRLANEVVIVGN